MTHSLSNQIVYKSTAVSSFHGESCISLISKLDSMYPEMTSYGYVARYITDPEVVSRIKGMVSDLLERISDRPTEHGYHGYRRTYDPVLGSLSHVSQYGLLDVDKYFSKNGSDVVIDAHSINYEMEVTCEDAYSWKWMHELVAPIFPTAFAKVQNLKWAFKVDHISNWFINAVHHRAAETTGVSCSIEAGKLDCTFFNNETFRVIKNQTQNVYNLLFN